MTSETVTVRRGLPAAPERVFGAWTDADRLSAWWWPQLAGTTYDVEARRGGSYAITSPVIGVTVSGVYTEVQPPHRLAFTWHWDVGGTEQGVEDTVVVTLEPQDDATQVTVEHTSVAHEPDGSTAQGWNDVLGRLALLFSEGPEGQSTSSRS